MNKLLKGIIAGFAATVVLTLMMFVKGVMGLMPALDPVGMIAQMMELSATIAWVIHFMIGSIIWGGAFALLEPRLPGADLWLRGVVFSVGAWLIMMVVMMPMAGTGFLGMQLGMMAPVMTLVMHLVFGAVLGVTYGMLPNRGTPQTT